MRDEAERCESNEMIERRKEEEYNASTPSSRSLYLSPSSQSLILHFLIFPLIDLLHFYLYLSLSLF